MKAKTALSASVLAIAAFATPLAAQDEQAEEETAEEIAAEEASAAESGEFEKDGELSVSEAAVYGGTGYAIYRGVRAPVNANKMPTRTLTTDQIRDVNANRAPNAGRGYYSGSPNPVDRGPHRAADVVNARDAAGSPRNIQTLESPAGNGTNRAAIGNGSALDDLDTRGQSAQRARANAIAGSADDMARVDTHGRLAQQIRANRAVSPSGTTTLASPETMGARAQAARANAIGGAADDLARLEARGNAAQRPRANAFGGSADELARLEARGNAAQRPRANAIGGTADDLARLDANGARAQNTRFNRVGSTANLDTLARQGRFAQDARGRGLGNASNPALEARGNAARNTRFQARNVNAAARGGSGFERAMQGRVGPEGTSRLIGQGDAAQAARGRIVNEGQLARNINAQGGDIGRLNQAGRSAQVRHTSGIPRGAPTPATGVAKPAGRLGKVSKFGSNMAKGAVVGIAATESVKALTGAEMDDPLATGFRYGSAIFDKDVTMGDVARDRWEHHKSNFRKIGETLTTKGKLKENMRNYGADKREKIGSATGMELHAMRDTQQRYADALKGSDKLKNLGQVAGDRAQHHWGNTKKVGSKIGCGIGNIFRKKENDKDC
ncbi:hypothetical protein HUO12_08190 [Altererythrobacter sp. JGD-16]|uniref:Uncharacterized protein n=2 Tax=Altererythrobacter lutimaris TaxID=2743979 RepID=A0A850HDP7_9SPHN|nr:hypothetical protein [Altererythrobacter lutimaris]